MPVGKLQSIRNVSQLWLPALTVWLGMIDFSRDDYSGTPMTNLVEIIKFVKPTALLGLSTITVRASGHPAGD